MKAVVLCLVLTVVGLNANSVYLDGSQKEKALQYSLDCIQETGVKPELVAEAKEGRIADDEDLKKFILCFFLKTGIASSDGTLNIETALAKIPPGVDKDETAKVLENCSSKKGKDAADTAFEILKCYHSGTKTHILL